MITAAIGPKDLSGCTSYLTIADGPFLAPEELAVAGPRAHYVNLSNHNQLLACHIEDKLGKAGPSLSWSAAVSLADKFSDDEWRYLFEANRAVAKRRLLEDWSERAARSLGFSGDRRIARIPSIPDIFNNIHNRLFVKPNDSFIRLAEKEDNVPLVKYYVAQCVSINGSIIEALNRLPENEGVMRIINDLPEEDRVNTEYGMHVGFYYSHILHALLFSLPYAKDWKTRSLESMLLDNDMAVAELRDFASIYPDYYGRFLKSSFDAVNKRTYYVYCGSNYYHDAFLYLVFNAYKLRGTIVNNREALNKSGVSIATPVKRFEAFDDGIVRCAATRRLDQLRKAITDVSPLPRYVRACQLNKASNAALPVISAIDECGMRVLLVPATRKALDSMLKLYGFEEHDPLYPERADVKILLDPSNSEFPAVFCENYGCAYIGEVNIAEYFEGGVGAVKDSGSGDYVFHAFYDC